MKIAILYGTETGNAEMLAEDLADALSADHDTTCTNLEDVTPEDLRAVQINIIVCSSYGDGELPASAQPFEKTLRADAPDLSKVRFAMFGLGDSEYAATFGQASKQLAGILTPSGAEQIGPWLVHDASGDDLPEDIALAWAQGILAELGA